MAPRYILLILLICQTSPVNLMNGIQQRKILVKHSTTIFSTTTRESKSRFAHTIINKCQNRHIHESYKFSKKSVSKRISTYTQILQKFSKTRQRYSQT